MPISGHLFDRKIPNAFGSQFQGRDRKDGREDRALLIGNGFSSKHFTYSSLLAASGLKGGKPRRTVFDKLGTADFEAVVHALEDSVIVEQAYGNDDHAKELETHVQAVREALVHALNKTHPAHREDLDYAGCTAFLANFGTIFSLNYDLLLYWASLEGTKRSDGFGLGSAIGRFYWPFNESANCEAFNLHGGTGLSCRSHLHDPRILGTAGMAWRKPAESQAFNARGPGQFLGRRAGRLAPPGSLRANVMKRKYLAWETLPARNDHMIAPIIVTDARVRHFIVANALKLGYSFDVITLRRGFECSVSTFHPWWPNPQFTCPLRALSSRSPPSTNIRRLPTW